MEIKENDGTLRQRMNIGSLKNDGGSATPPRTDTSAAG